MNVHNEDSGILLVQMLILRSDHPTTARWMKKGMLYWHPVCAAFLPMEGLHKSILLHKRTRENEVRTLAEDKSFVCEVFMKTADRLHINQVGKTVDSTSF